MDNGSQYRLTGTGKTMEPANKLRAECVFVGNAVSPKVEIELEPTAHGSFCGHATFEIAGSKFSARLILMPEKVGNVFARRENGHVIYPEVGE